MALINNIMSKEDVSYWLFKLLFVQICLPTSSSWPLMY